MPLERMDDFREFHASELYLGAGAFEGIEEKKRFDAIRVLLHSVKHENLHYIYSAADRKKFSQSPFGSGRPLHSAFHVCLPGVEDWATTNHDGWRLHEGKIIKTLDWKDTVLYIADYWDKKEDKEQF